MVKDTTGVHGSLFQRNLLTLFLYRGIKQNYCFDVGTEVPEGEKFDDIEIKYSRKGRTCKRLFQAKHKSNQKSKINSKNLLIKPYQKNNDFSLLKYFLSNQKLKAKFECSTIKNLTLCTNIDFDTEDLSKNGIEIEEITRYDPFLDSKSHLKSPSKYRFCKSIIPILVKLIREYSTKDVAEALAGSLLESKNQSNILNEFAKTLSEEVLDVGNKTFREKFLKGDGLSSYAQELRGCFEEEIIRKSNGKWDLNILCVKLQEGNSEKEMMIRLDGNFGRWRNDDWSSSFDNIKQEVADFIDLLEFAVRQPNEEELGRILKEELLEEYNELVTELVCFKLSRQMMDLLQGKYKVKRNQSNRYFSSDEGKKIIENVRNFSLSYRKCEFKKCLDKIPFKYNLKSDFQKFLTSSQRLWLIPTDTPWLSSLYLHQDFKAGNHDLSYHNLKWNDILDDERFISEFKGLEDTLIIITCLEATAMKGTSEVMIREIAHLLSEENCNSKRIIVIGSNKHEIINKLRAEYQECYRETITLGFNDLDYESQALILNKKNILFRGYLNYSLTQFLLSNGQEFSEEQITKLNLDASSLEILIRNEIRNQKINIWYKTIDIDDNNMNNFKQNISIKLKKVKEAITSCGKDCFAFLCEEKHVKSLSFHLGVEFKRLKNVKKPFHQDRIVLLNNVNEGKEFSQLCRMAETCQCGLEEHTIHKLKYDGERLTWIQIYCTSFYTPRYLRSTSLTLNDIKTFLVSPESSDLIILSKIEKEELFSLINFSCEEKYFLENNCIFEYSVERAEKKFYSMKSLMTREKIYEPADGLLPLKTKKNIHWVHTSKSDLQYRFVWYQSEVDVHKLRGASHAVVQSTVLPETLVAKMKQRLVLIADRPGMGKSSLLTHFVHVLEREEEKSFIMKIDLNLHQDFIPHSVSTKEDIIDFILNFCQEPSNKPLIRKILSFKMENSDGVVLLFDGFDEMRKNNQESFLSWVKFALRETNIRIWISTRSSHKEKLENALHTLSYSFLPLSRLEIVIFLVKFWEKLLTFLGGNSPRHELFIPSLIKTAVMASGHCMDIFGYESITSFFEIPLVLRMSAENISVVMKGILISMQYRYVSSLEVKCAIQKNVNALHIFDAFVDRKCEIHIQETGIKRDVNRDSELALRNAYLSAYGLLALKAMEGSEREWQFVYEKKTSISLDTLSKIGMITKYNNTDASFIHPSLEHYFASNLICSKLMSYADYDIYWRVLVNVILVNELSLKFFDHHVKNNEDLMNIQVDEDRRNLVYSLMQEQVNSGTQNVALWEAAYFGLESSMRFLINIIGLPNIRLLLTSHDYLTARLVTHPNFDEITECFFYGKQLSCYRKCKTNPLDEILKDNLSNDPYYNPKFFSEVMRILNLLKEE